MYLGRYKIKTKIIICEILNLNWLNDQINFFIYYPEEILNFKEILIKLKIEFFFHQLLPSIATTFALIEIPRFFVYRCHHIGNLLQVLLNSTFSSQSGIYLINFNKNNTI